MSYPFEKAKAKYTPFPLEDFRGNPLVEAMYPIPYNDEELDRRLRVVPKIDESTFDLPAQLRVLLPRRLKQVFLPGPLHRRIYRMLSHLVLDTYRDRNPMGAEGQLQLYSDGMGTSCGPSNTYGRMATVIGPSGVGKSTSIMRGLQALGPQVIFHEEYEGAPFHETQLLYHYLNISESLRPADIYLAAGRAAAALSGNKLLMKTPGAHRSLEDKRDYCSKVLRSTFNGVLVIDNIEYLFRAPEPVRNEVQSMIVHIRDFFKIPMLLVGTVEAAPYLAADGSVVSRFIEGGYLELKRPESHEDPYWDDLVETLWSFSWVKNPIELDAPLKQKIYDLTQGVTRLLVDLLVRAQSIAIESGLERVDATVLDRAYAEFVLIHPIIAALETKDPNVMADYESMYSAATQALEGKGISETQQALEAALAAQPAANADSLPRNVA